MRSAKLAAAAIACALGAIMAPPAVAAPEALTVTRFDDPPPDGCAPTDCSLREAAIVSNTDPVDRDSIRLAPGTYVLSIPGSGAFQGDLDLSSAVDIVNTGTDEVLIDANGAVTGERALQVLNQPPGTVEVWLDRVSITSGIAPLDGDSLARGGAVRVEAGTEFRMEGGRIASSRADRTHPQNGVGGAIWNAGQTVLIDVTLSQNSAAGSSGAGGAIFTAGGLVSVSYSTIERNDATFGGAIASDGGSTSLYSSRVARNEATSSGGGGYMIDGGALYLENSTLADNTTGGSGGGAMAANGLVQMETSTVTQNAASDGGGVSVYDTPGGDVGVIALQNTIVGGNRDTIGLNGSRPDCASGNPSQIFSRGYNLISSSKGCFIPTTGDITGGVQGHPDPILPRLGPSGYHGGYTDTVPLKPNSPAVNAGDPDGGSCEAVDARELPRALGGRCDIGAYELARCRGVIVTRVGSEFDDFNETFMLAPSKRPGGFLGLQGHDVLRGGPKADGLCGGEGDDTLKAGAGDDLIAGGPGQDVCVGGPGKDKAKGCEVERSIP